ncbi:hypothetical protein [Gemmobacter sp. 24YEA27]|uniref:hypothetical protein n=1 Tax=Gemmobacter sp. 24YEA27 TaxID=3040672 RepID=UPI0024B3A518|nr:hypothetical protein [Gemmobacter sp. 24YEA27]
MTLRVVLPWAKTSELSGNGRLHWRARNNLIGKQKEDATKRAWEAGLHLVRIPDGVDIPLHLTICPPTAGGWPDDDNVIAAQKGALDALAAVLKVNDRRFRIQEPIRGERCKGGAVIVEIRPALVLIPHEGVVL